MKQHVLFICVHNSARSQMAEALLNQMCGDFFIAESAGLEPGNLNPLAADVLREMGLDISGKKTRSVTDALESGLRYDHVITVCDESSAARCPTFPGRARRWHWSFADPSNFTGDHAEQITRTREVRDAIQRKIEEWCAQLCRASAA
jgi:arsenate reductase